MKIEYGALTLCDGVEYIGTAGKFIGPLGTNVARKTWDQSPRKYIGAENATPCNLGNALGEFPLRVGVEFATVSAAHYFYLTYPDSLPASGTLTVTGDDGETKVYQAASIVECIVDQSGCSCVIDYKFQTGVSDDEA